MIKKDLTITSITEKTIELLKNSDKTFEELSVTDICQINSITKPTFYKYVDNKESILRYYFRLQFYELASDFLQQEFETPLDALLEGMALNMSVAESMGVVLYRSFVTITLKNNLEPDPLFEDLLARIHQLYEQSGLSITYQELIQFMWEQQFGLGYYWITQNGGFPLKKTFKNQIRRVLGVKTC